LVAARRVVHDPGAGNVAMSGGCPMLRRIATMLLVWAPCALVAAPARAAAPFDPPATVIGPGCAGASVVAATGGKATVLIMSPTRLYARTQP
jgi:hypothetical protein